MYKSFLFFKVIDFDSSSSELDQMLENFRYRPIKASEETSVGWVSPYGDEAEEDSLVRSVMNHHALTFKVCEKKIRSAVLKEQVRLRFLELKKSPMGPQKLDKKVKKELEITIKAEMLPVEKPVVKKINAYFDTDRNYLIIEGASTKTAESIIQMLMRAFEAAEVETKILSIAVNNSVTGTITSWVVDATVVPDDIILGSKCSLSGPEGQLVKYNRHELSEEKLKRYISEDEMDVAELEVEYDEKVSFTLSGDLSARGIKALEGLEENNDVDNEDGWEADFILQVDTFGTLIGSIIDWMGGESEGGEFSMESESDDD